MSKIGTFKKAAEGILSGALHTLHISRDIDFHRVEPTSENAPAYRAVLSGTDVVVGAGWLKTAKESGNTYISIQLDDPSLTAPLYARLVREKDSEDLALYWERKKANSSQDMNSADPA